MNTECRMKPTSPSSPRSHHPGSPGLTEHDPGDVRQCPSRAVSLSVVNRPDPGSIAVTEVLRAVTDMIPATASRSAEHFGPLSFIEKGRRSAPGTTRGFPRTAQRLQRLQRPDFYTGEGHELRVERREEVEGARG